MIRKDNEGNILEKGIYYNKRNDSYFYKFVDREYKSRCIFSKTLPKLYKRIEYMKASGVIPLYASDEPTLDEYVYETLRTKIYTGSNYINDCRKLYNSYVKNRIGHKKLTEIKHDDIVNLYIEITNDGLAVRTVENVHIFLSGIFRKAIRNDIINKNVTQDAFYQNFNTKLAKYASKKNKYLSFDETEMLFSEIKKKGTVQDYNIATVLFGTGMRIGELVGLTWNDIDFENKTINIDHQLSVKYVLPKDIVKLVSDDNTSKDASYNMIYDMISDRLYDDGLYWDIMDNIKMEYTIKDTKTKASHRVIPMIDEVYWCLRDEYRIQRMCGITCREKYDGYSGFIFINRYGDIRKHANIMSMIDKYVNSYNKSQKLRYELYGFEPKYLKHISPHMARHTFCSRLFALKDNIKLVQEIMGHASYKTTSDIYNEITSDLLIKTMTNSKLELM